MGRDRPSRTRVRAQDSADLVGNGELEMAYIAGGHDPDVKLTE
jgi:hypothetical protein